MSEEGCGEEEQMPGFAGSWKVSCGNRPLSHKWKPSGQRSSAHLTLWPQLQEDWSVCFHTSQGEPTHQKKDVKATDRTKGQVNKRSEVPETPS